VAGQIFLNLTDAALFFDIKLVNVDSAQLLLKPFDILHLIADLGLAVQHQIMRASNLV
jgi:hypothetical protein